MIFFSRSVAHSNPNLSQISTGDYQCHFRMAALTEESLLQHDAELEDCPQVRSSYGFSWSCCLRRAGGHAIKLRGRVAG